MISIIVPIYNMEAFLDKCISSIQSQSFEDYEVLLVNDGSTDSSEQMIDAYVAKDPKRFRKISKENGGLADTLNRGMKEAVGEYLVFLDADDYIEEHFLERLYTEAVRNQADVVISGQHKVTDQGEILQTISYHPVHGHCERLRLNLHGKMYRRAYVESLGLSFPVGKLYEDNSFNLQAYFLTRRLSFLEYEGYEQLVREGSITSKAIEKDRLPLEEWNRCAREVYQAEGVCQDLFEFTVESLFAYLLFVRIRKREFRIKGEGTKAIVTSTPQSKEELKKKRYENALAIAEAFEEIVNHNFDLKKKNSYLKIFSSSDIGLSQVMAVKVFRSYARRKKLYRLVKLLYR